jgi:hypothetical protein
LRAGLWSRIFDIQILLLETQFESTETGSSSRHVRLCVSISVKVSGGNHCALMGRPARRPKLSPRAHRQRLAVGIPKFDIAAIVLRAIDHDPVLPIGHFGSTHFPSMKSASSICLLAAAKRSEADAGRAV